MNIPKLLKKILLGQFILFGSLTILVLWLSNWYLQRELIAESQKREVAIAQSIANASEHLGLGYSYEKLPAIIREFSDIQEVAYILVTDESNQIIAHTFGSTIPAAVTALLDQPQVKPATASVYRTEINLPDLGTINDIALPVVTGLGGYIHVGINYHSINSQVLSMLVAQIGIIIVLLLASMGIGYRLIVVNWFKIAAHIDENLLLTEDNQQLVTLADHVPVAMLVSRLPDGLILYANQHAAAAFGLSSEQLLQHHISDFYQNPNERQQILQQFQQQGYLYHYDLSMKRFDQTPRWFTLFLQSLEFGHQPAILGIFYDITSHKQMEDDLLLFTEALQANEKKYRTVFDSASEAILIIDQQLQIVDFNPSTLAMFNCTFDAVLGNSPAMLSPPAQPDGSNSERQIKEKIEAALAGTAQLFEWVYKKGEGSLFYAEVELNPIELNEGYRVQAIIRDITKDRQRTEEERSQFTNQLQKSEERFQVIAQTTPIPVIITRVMDDKIVYANEQASVAFGVLPTDLVGRGIKELFLNLADWQEVANLLGRDGFIYDYEIRMKRLDNTVIWVSWFSQPTIFNDEPVMVNTLYDITERKQAEEERISYINELDSLNTMLTEFNAAYERFVPYEFLQLLGKENVIDVHLGDQIEREMTVLFSDIRGFTSLSEKMTPQENFNFINSYLSQMAPIITEHQGFIDKYIGDAIMALFATGADDAVRCAVAMLKQLDHYNRSRQSLDISWISIGIGLNTGPLMLGTVGDENRMEGTVISDSVNLASRVEGLTKIYGTALLITEQTYQQLSDISQYHIRVIDRVTVKGKTQAVTIYEVFDADSSDLIALKSATLSDFEIGFQEFHQHHFIEAKARFEQVLKQNPLDKVAQVYLMKCH